MKLSRVSVLLAVFVLVCFTPGVLADGSLCFDALSYSVAQKPAGMAVGDFNDDGHPDLGRRERQIRHRTRDSLDTHRQRRWHLPARGGLSRGQVPDRISVGDFNEDGNLDVAIANYGYDYDGGAVAILLGNGDGTFQSRREFPAGTNTYFILVGDFNCDAHLDVAVGNNNWPQGVTILLGDGYGSVAGFAHYYLNGSNPRGGVAADVNGDGNLDLAVGVYQWPAGVEILLGNGNGTFQPPTHYDVPGNVSAVRGGDLNGDGRVDLVTTSFESDTISILLGNGDGTFRLDASYAVGRTPVAVSVGDIDQDGADDVVVASADASFVSALLGNGDGTLGTMTPYPLADVAWHWVPFGQLIWMGTGEPYRGDQRARVHYGSPEWLR